MARHFSRTVVAMVLLTAGSAFAANHGHNKGAAPGHAMAQALTAESAASMPVAQGVSASGCWIRLLPAPAPSAGYFVLKNDTDAEVALTGAAAKDYGLLMVHQTRHENGMSRMAMIDEVPVPAKGSLEFKPGGYHIMLEQPKRDIAVGDTVQVDLVLKSGQKVVADCEVKPAGTAPAMKRHMAN